MRLLSAFALWLCCCVAWAQTPVDPPLSFSEVRTLWLAHSREVSLARSNAEAAAADVVTAGQVPNPQVSMNVLSISPWSGYRAGGWRDKKMDSALRLEQLIERGDKRQLRVQAAEAARQASRHDMDEVQRLQHLQVSAAYYDLLGAQERQSIVRQAAQLYEDSLAAARLRLRVGDIAVVDFSRLQVDAQRAANERLQAEAEMEKAQIVLAYFIGQEESASQLRVNDAWPDIVSVPRGGEGIPGKRPDLAAATLRLEAAQKARDLARAQQIRDVTVGVQLEHNLQNAPTNSYGFGVSIPLFVWHEYQGGIARAEAELDMARQQLAVAQAQARGDVDLASGALRVAADRRQRLEDGLLRNAENIARAAEFAYARGAMGVMDLLDARRTLRQVQIEAVSARVEHAKALAAWKLQAEFGN